MKKNFIIMSRAFVVSLLIMIMSIDFSYAQGTGQNFSFDQSTPGNYSYWKGYQAQNISSGSTMSFTPWTTFNNPATCTWQGADCFVINSNVNEFDSRIPTLKKIPNGYTRSTQINCAQNNKNANMLTYDLDVNDQNCLLTFNFAIIMESPGHPGYESPFFRIEIVGLENGVETARIADCALFEVKGDVSSPPPGWSTFSGGIWQPWRQVSMNLTENLGTTVRVKIILAACEWSGHWAYGYFVGKVGPAELTLNQSGNGDTMAFIEAPTGFQKYEWLSSPTDFSDYDNQFANSTPIYTSQSIGGNPANNKLIIRQSDQYINDQYFVVKLTSQNSNPNIPSCESYIKTSFIVDRTYNDTIIAYICPGESYNQFGFNESEAGFYTQNLQTIYNYDSIRNLILIVNPIYNDTITAVVCQGVAYNQFGFNENETGFYTQNLQTVQGCDSIVNLSLIVNPTYLISHNDVICQGELYSNYGVDFIADTTGLYIQNLQTTKGCDSIITLNLIVNPIYNQTIEASICEGNTYSLNGFNESTAGIYKQELQTINGCDSIVNLSLIINPIYNDTIIAEVCQGDVYNQFGFNESVEGFYTQSLQTTNGCDSIVNLNLIVNPIYNDTIIASICQGQAYTQFGFNEALDGFYTQSLQTIKGCDSIVNLSLVVIIPPSVELDMVTVNSDNNNEVIWSKKEIVDHYNIYREGTASGQYDLIATVPYSSESIFIDTNSNPAVQAYMYKISTTDTCMNESERSPFHKTMYLSIGQATGNNWNLNWTPYIGANYSAYNIYRGINSLNSLEYLTTISASNTSYTDMNTSDGYFYYQIEIIKETITAKNTKDVKTIRSNFVTNNPIALTPISYNDISIILYPNPTNNKAILEIQGLKESADIIVSDLLGRLIKKYKFNPEQEVLEIDVKDYSKGPYNVSIQNKNVNITKKLIVQ